MHRGQKSPEVSAKVEIRLFFYFSSTTAREKLVVCSYAWLLRNVMDT